MHADMMKLIVTFRSFATAITNHVIYMYYSNITKFSSLFIYIYINNVRVSLGPMFMFFGIRNISDNSCKENQHTHFIFNNFFLKNGAVYEITWKNIVHSNRPEMTTQRIARCITKVTNPHSA